VIIYFTRHGESVANTSHVISNRSLDHPLTPAGRLQAESLARRLSTAGLTAVYTSPVPRARETASILCQALNLPLQQADGLREFDCGTLEGRSGPFAWWRFSRVLHYWFTRRMLEKRFRGGESFLDVQARFLSLMESLADQYAHSDERILCVAHGGVLHIGLSGLFNHLSFEQVTAWPIPYTAVIESEYQNGRFICIRWDGVTIPLEQ